MAGWGEAGWDLDIGVDWERLRDFSGCTYITYHHLRCLQTLPPRRGVAFRRADSPYQQSLERSVRRLSWGLQAQSLILPALHLLTVTSLISNLASACAGFLANHSGSGIVDCAGIRTCSSTRVCTTRVSFGNTFDEERGGAPF